MVGEEAGLSLETALLEKKKTGKKILIVYLTGGFPSIRECIELMQDVADAGADLIELGIPFSDPVMDGPVIQAASAAALRRGVTPLDVLECAARSEVSVPIAIMTYYNLVHRRGLRRFAKEASQAGVGGVIIPDLPLEELSEWEEVAVEEGLAPILLAAPNAPDVRLSTVCKRSRGFIYAVSLLGVTGERSQLSSVAESIARRIQSFTDLVVALGIGISTPNQAAEACQFADGVIVGSAIVKQILDSPEKAVDLVVSMRRAIDVERDRHCLLCKAERITDWFYEDDECWIATCDQCDTPMVVWRSHGIPTDAIVERLKARLEDVAITIFGKDGYWLDPIMRNIPDHFHCHARPAGGFFGPSSPLATG